MPIDVKLNIVAKKFMVTKEWSWTLDFPHTDTFVQTCTTYETTVKAKRAARRAAKRLNLRITGIRYCNLDGMEQTEHE